MPILPKISPKDPDPYLVRLGSNKSKAALARLAHINALIDQINLNTEAIAGGDPVKVGNTLFLDNVYGDDTTALRQRFDKPFLTPGAAMSAAQDGDTIIWRPGTYRVFDNLIKQGVNHYAMKGVFLDIFSNVFNLDTGQGGPTVVGNVDFRGHAVITSCTGNLCNIRSNPDVILNLEFDEVTVNNISNGVLISDGLTYLKIRGNYNCEGRCFSTRDTARLIAHIDGICTTTFANTFNGVFWNSSAAWSGTAYIKALSFALPNTVIAGNFRHIYQDNAQGCKIDIELDYLTDNSSVTPGIIIISSAGGTTGCEASLKIKNLNVDTRRIFECSDSNAKLRIQYDLATGITSGASVTNGVVNLDSSRIYLSSNIILAGGLLYMNNTLFENDGGTVAITQLAGRLSLMGTTLVTDGIAASINNLGGTTLSEASKANVAPVNPVTGNLYINASYTA